MGRALNPCPLGLPRPATSRESEEGANPPSGACRERAVSHMLKAPALPSQIPAFAGSPLGASLALSGHSDLLLHPVLAMTGDRAVEAVAAGLELDRHRRVGAGLDVLGCLGRTGALDVHAGD